MTLRSRLALAFLLVVMLPLVVGTVLLHRGVPAAVQDRQARGLVSAAQLVGRLVQSTCGQASAAAGAAARAATPGATPAQVQAVADQLVRDGLADGVRLRDARGGVVASSGELPDVVADCTSPPLPAEPLLGARLGLRTAQGAPSGTVEVVLQLDRLLPALQEGSDGGDVAVLSPDGRTPLAATHRVPRTLALAALSDPGHAVTRDGAVAVASRTGPLPVVVAEPLADVPLLVPVALGVLLGAALLAALLAVQLARATTRPLEELGVAAGRIASGDLTTTIPVRGSDEVARLAEAFNGMALDLRTYVGALQAGRDELQAGLSRLGATLSGTHDLDRILAVVLETAMASTRARAGMVLLLSPGRDELVLAVARGLDLPPDLRLPVGSGVSGRVASSGEPLHGRTGDGPGRLRQGPGEPAARSVVSVPFTSGGTVLGVLDLYDRVDADEFDANDLASVRTFASQATVAVDNVLLHQDVQRMAVTDGLTGLGNFRHYTVTMTREAERAARFGRPLALLLLDLDRFKAVNDTHGHQRGDAVLVEVAARVRDEVRDVDTVARYGGEEIAVVLPETDREGACNAAARICEAVRRRPFGEPGEVPLTVTVSAGVAVFPEHGTTPASLLRAADTALYDAKGAGRDTWRLARPPVGGPH
ncbi:MAG: diguanylate cyclase with sensor [Frankiales bacterium]|nr:diguanylate cyclase with sensor [Frankiales bacterium]